MQKKVITTALLSVFAAGAMAQGMAERPASGKDLSVQGAATRISGDQSAALKSLINPSARRT